MNPTHPFWSSLFGGQGAVEIEIGPGTGTFILPAAATNSHINYLGIEHSHSRATHLQNALREQRLTNAIVVAADAACVVGAIIPTACVRAYHVYFPDPWWKRRHHRRRLFTPVFAAALARTLVDGGELHLATDVDQVFQLMSTTIAATGAFNIEPTSRSPRRGATVFERKGVARGASIHEATFVMRRRPS
jgi:tRNA (guanine-N7-)-methyltransferase